MPGSALVYTRVLPNGGFVAIEALADGSAPCAARLLVERRTDPTRRSGHTPPVIAESRGDDRDRVLGELYEIATSNVRIAQRLMTWQETRRAQGPLD